MKVLSRVFRGKFIAGLKDAFQHGKLLFPGSLKQLSAAPSFHAFLRPLFRNDWIVYAKRPFGGPQHVLQYLARYTHRVAISNHRIIGVAKGNVTFRWKDYAHKSKQKLMTVSAEEFLRRYSGRIRPMTSAEHGSSQASADLDHRTIVKINISSDDRIASTCPRNRSVTGLQ